VKAILLVTLAACAGTGVRDTAAVTAGKIVTARDNGAQTCAPVELATAEAHNDYAVHQLDEGNYAQARDAEVIAAKNAQLAIDHSPVERCAPKKPVVVVKTVEEPPPPPPVEKPPVDSDGDGLVDSIDQCPNEPEDKDNFQDDDGCPDPDNDQDGILDVDDKCPNEPGVPPDGCPRVYKNIVVTETKIELKQTVYFDTNKTTIKPVSFSLLDEVASAMKDHPKLTVEIQGHTDSQGDDNFNLKLSQGRAESVRTYLIKQGISSDRMVPKGYGETTPVADNRTADGRAQNRRVEFVITGR